MISLKKNQSGVIKNIQEIQKKRQGKRNRRMRNKGNKQKASNKMETKA